MSDLNPLSLAKLSLHRLEILRDELTQAGQAMQSEVKRNRERLMMVSEAIRQASHKAENIDVSDHAVVRYLERFTDVDVEAIREKLRAAVEGRFDPTDEHEVVFDEHSNAVMIIRGAMKGKKVPSIVTVLDREVQDIPEKGQLKISRDFD